MESYGFEDENSLNTTDKEINQSHIHFVEDNEQVNSLGGESNELLCSDGFVSGSLHVAELDVRVDEDMLYQFFGRLHDCTVTSVKIVRDKYTKISLGYAYVNFETNEQAQSALNQLNFTKLSGRVIRISLTKEKSQISKQRRNNKANLYVKHLDPSVDSRELYLLFKEYGTIKSVRVIEHYNGISKGFGFVCFEEEVDAIKAMESLSDTEFKGKKIHVSIALCQSEDGTKVGRKSNRNTPIVYNPYWTPMYYVPYESERMSGSYIPAPPYSTPMNNIPVMPVYPLVQYGSQPYYQNEKTSSPSSYPPGPQESQKA